MSSPQRNGSSGARSSAFLNSKSSPKSATPTRSFPSSSSSNSASNSVASSRGALFPITPKDSSVPTSAMSEISPKNSSNINTPVAQTHKTFYQAMATEVIQTDLDIHIPVPCADSIVKYSFSVSPGDILFSTRFHPSKKNSYLRLANIMNGEAGSGGSSIDDENGDTDPYEVEFVTVVGPIKSRNYSGSFVALTEGTVTIHFDNSSSWLAAKTVQYMVEVEQPIAYATSIPTFEVEAMLKTQNSTSKATEDLWRERCRMLQATADSLADSLRECTKKLSIETNEKRMIVDKCEAMERDIKISRAKEVENLQLIQQCKERVAAADKTSARCEETMNDLRIELSQARALNASLEADMKERKLETDALQQQISVINSMKAASEAKVGMLQVEIESLKEELKLARLSASTSTAELQTALNTMADTSKTLREELTRSRMEAASLQQHANEMNAEKEAAKSSLATANGQISMLKASESMKEKHIIDLQEKLKDVMKTLNEVVTERDAHKNSVMQSASEISLLQTSQSIKDRQLQELHNCISDFEKSQKSLTSELASKSGALSEAEAQIRGLTSELASCKAKVTLAEKKLQEVEGLHQESMADLSHKMRIISNLTNETQDLRRSRDELQNVEKECHDKIRQLESDIRAAKNDVAMANQSVEKQKKLMESLESKESVLESEKLALRESLMAAESEVRQLRQKIDSLNSEKLEIHHRHDAEMSEARSRIKHLENALHDSDATISSLNKEISAISSSNDSLIRQLSDKVKMAGDEAHDAQSRLKYLEMQLASETTQKDLALEQVKTHLDTIKHFESRLDEAVLKLNDASASATAEKEATHRLQAKIKDLEHNVSIATNAAAAAEERRKQTEHDFMSMKEIYQATLEEMSGIKSELTLARAFSGELEERIAATENELQVAISSGNQVKLALKACLETKKELETRLGSLQNGEAGDMEVQETKVLASPPTPPRLPPSQPATPITPATAHSPAILSPPRSHTNTPNDGRLLPPRDEGSTWDVVGSIGGFFSTL